MTDAMDRASPLPIGNSETMGVLIIAPVMRWLVARHSPGGG